MMYPRFPPPSEPFCFEKSRQPNAAAMVRSALLIPILVLVISSESIEIKSVFKLRKSGRHQRIGEFTSHVVNPSGIGRNDPTAADLHSFPPLQSSIQPPVYEHVPDGGDSAAFGVVVGKLLFGVPVLYGYLRVASYLHRLCLSSSSCTDVTLSSTSTIGTTLLTTNTRGSLSALLTTFVCFSSVSATTTSTATPTVVKTTTDTISTSVTVTKTAIQIITFFDASTSTTTSASTMVMKTDKTTTTIHDTWIYIYNGRKRRFVLDAFSDDEDIVDHSPPLKVSPTLSPEASEANSALVVSARSVGIDEQQWTLAQC